MKNILWTGVIASSFILVTLSQLQLPQTQRLKTKPFQFNILLAAFSYFGVFNLLPLIYRLFRPDPFLSFHPKQGFILLGLLLLSIVTTKYVLVPGIIFFIILASMAIFAMIQASRGYYWRLPLVRKLLP